MIGIFDSGIGGLSLVKELKKSLPEVSFVYFGDTGRTPYGNKGLDTVRGFAQEAYEFLHAQGAVVCVIACNTASAAAADFLRAQNSMPIIDVIESGCTGALQETKSRTIGVMATAGTISSHAHATFLRKSASDVTVHEYPCPSLATLIEDSVISEGLVEAAVREYLADVDPQIDALILGCTHYPLITGIIQKVVGDGVQLIDPAQKSVAQLQNYLRIHPECNLTAKQGGKDRYFVSDQQESFDRLVEKFLGERVSSEMAQL